MKITLFWHRRDLRFQDNAGLAAALQSGHPVLPLFIYDQTILEKLPKNDARLTFIFDQVERLADEAHEAGGGFYRLVEDEPRYPFNTMVLLRDADELLGTDRTTLRVRPAR